MMSDSADTPRRSKVKQALAHNVIFRATSQIATAGIYVLLVRAFTESEFGIYQLFYTIPPVIAAVFSLGIAVTLSRYMPEYLANRQYAYAQQLLSWARRIRLSTSIVILGAVILFWDQIAPLFKIQDYKSYFYVFAAITVTHLQCRLLNIGLSSYLLQQWSMGLVAAFSFAKLAGYLFVLLYEFSLMNVLVVDLIAYLVWHVSQNWAFRKYVPRPDSKERFPDAERKRILRFGVLNNFNDVGSLTLNSRTDNLFIAAYMDPVSVGAYAFCTQLEQMLQKFLPTRFFGSVLHAVVYKLNYVTEAHRATQYFAFLVKLNFLCMFPIFAVVAAIPEPLIIVVFGGKFIEYSNLLMLVFAFALISAFQQPVGLIASLGERAGIVFLSKIFAIYNIVAIIILIPLWGVIGAAIATGTSIFFKNLFIWYFIRQVASFRGMLRFFLQQSALWLGCWALLRYVDSQVSDLIAVALAVLIVGLSLLASLRLADLSAGDWEVIDKFGSKRMRRLLRFVGLSS